jgi:magnesium transporter
LLRVLRAEDGNVASGGVELVRPGAPIWIDCDPTAESLAFLGDTFHFHPLALEDCEVEDQRPKLDQYPGAHFLVVHRLTLAPDDAGIVPLEVDTFLTAEALVTVHKARIPELDVVFERCRADPTLLGRGPDFALYHLLDAFLDVHYTLVDALTEQIDAFADEVSGPEGVQEQEQMLERVVAARRAHAVLRRRLAPQREVFLALARPGQALVREQTALYFRDVVDHAVRLTEEVDTGRELLASLMDVLLSRTNNRLSAVTARLTLIATIFLPLNFLAGFFGMNLEIVHPHLAIPLVLAAMVALPVAMVAWFRRKRWL